MPRRDPAVTRDFEATQYNVYTYTEYAALQSCARARFRGYHSIVVQYSM